ncbi:uncharacterized protein LOC114524488 isoform X2 [Dendronephthya gigantea]|uniref:uncharacterized protein LOC114524488 isoform X2 n=1 Tax=Dendronephthya gigantea TaxID=151771 RepID=UPI00106B9681|nr:uncharacterized protein LOC114524488 isoform X2 [Dendronephthya gigantea]
MIFVCSFSNNRLNFKLYVIIYLFLMDLFMVSAGDEEVTAKTVEQVTVGHSVILTCKLKNKVSSRMLLEYTWTKNKVDVTVDPRFTVLMSGGLLVRRVNIEDAGTYKCRAKTQSDKDVPRVFRGLEVKMEVLYPPSIKLSKPTVIVSQGSDVQIPCTSQGNPSLITTKWMWNGEQLPKSFLPVIFPNGTLLLRSVKSDHDGIYKCTPFNEIGLGDSAETRLKVEAQPLFTQVPPRKLTAKLGESLTMTCKATIPRVTWRKVNSSLPKFRSTTHSGRLHIRDVQLEDSGVYECKVRTSRKLLRRSVELSVISTPTPPVIKNVEMLSKSAVVSWETGYNGGSRQTLEIWYKISNSDDYHWKSVKNIPADLTSYAVYDIEPYQSYLFSMRGKNKMGIGVFSRIFRTDRVTSRIYQHDKSKVHTKPLAPSNVSCTRTASGYQISWSYSQTPGRPQVQYFLVEYRRLNSSASWKSLGNLINKKRRQWLVDGAIVSPKVPYEFRMFSFGGAFSEPSRVANASPITGSVQSSTISQGNTHMWVAVSFASLVVVLLALGSYCYCYRFKKKRKNVTRKAKRINRSCKLPRLYSSTESSLSDSDFDSCDLHDVKFIPNVSSFVLESQENLHKSSLTKASRAKCEHKSGPSPLCEDNATSCVVGTLADTSNTRGHKGPMDQDYFPQNYEGYFRSQDDVPMAFNTGRLLPEFPELRDSYDQFCTTASEHSSRDDLEGGKLGNRGSGLSVLSELKSTRGMRDSMYCSEEDIRACKRRRKSIMEQDTDEKNHRWSMPEFTKLLQENCDNDPGYFLNYQYDSLVQQKGGQSHNEQSTQTCNTPVISKGNSEEPIQEYLSSVVTTPDYPNIEDQMLSAKERIILGESRSCPSLVPASTSYDARDCDSSGFYDDSGDDSVSPINSRDSVNTVKENPEWHGYKADLKDSGIYDSNEDVGSNSSLGEINVYASGSAGYEETSNGIRDSPEGQETSSTSFDQIQEKHVEKLGQSKHALEDSSSRANHSKNKDFHFVNGHVCDLQPNLKQVDGMKTSCHKNAHADRDISDGDKGKRCAHLMQEYIVNKRLSTHRPNSSFYRTSAV